MHIDMIIRDGSVVIFHAQIVEEESASRPSRGREGVIGEAHHGYRRQAVAMHQFASSSGCYAPVYVLMAVMKYTSQGEKNADFCPDI